MLNWSSLCGSSGADRGQQGVGKAEGEHPRKNGMHGKLLHEHSTESWEATKILIQGPSRDVVRNGRKLHNRGVSAANQHNIPTAAGRLLRLSRRVCLSCKERWLGIVKAVNCSLAHVYSYRPRSDKRQRRLLEIEV